MNTSNYLVQWVEREEKKGLFVKASFDDVVNQAIAIAEQYYCEVQIHQAAKLIGVVKKNARGKLQFQPCMQNWAA